MDLSKVLGGRTKFLHSIVDKSVNFVTASEDGGSIECRFVQRDSNYFIIYLSSHTGCNQACRFCHLTQMGETMMRPVTNAEFMRQVGLVLNHAMVNVDLYNITRVHVNFMARGEPLLNPNVNDDLMNDIEMALIPALGNVPVVFKVSTIMPMDRNPFHLSSRSVQIYYSLYSMDKTFRKRWLPKAERPTIALAKLRVWQKASGGKVVLHWALIDGENDSISDARNCFDAVQMSGLEDIRFNLVRYNPPNWKSTEASEEQTCIYMNEMKSLFGSENCKIIPRVGPDVYASCGCFYSGP